ncbi:MAG: hypothetical protein V7L21_20600 [Nostoc sp.]|uniref:hypothetical protein n=1 Tax=Nostoc sp. TaxID=1180 RepID=UPI002FF82692
MSNYRGVCNGCLPSLVASVCVSFGCNLVKQELTLAQSPVNKEAMPAAGYAYALLVRKTSVQSALVTTWKAKREPFAERSVGKAALKGASQTPISEVRQLNSIERPLSGTSDVLGVNRVKNLIALTSPVSS